MAISVTVSGDYYTTDKNVHAYQETFILPKCNESMAKAFIRFCLITPRLHEKKEEKYKSFSYCSSIYVNRIEPTKNKVDKETQEMFEYSVFLRKQPDWMSPDTSTKIHTNVVMKDLQNQVKAKKRKQAARRKKEAAESNLPKEQQDLLNTIVDEGLQDDFLNLLREQKAKKQKQEVVNG